MAKQTRKRPRTVDPAPEDTVVDVTPEEEASAIDEATSGETDEATSSEEVTTDDADATDSAEEIAGAETDPEPAATTRTKPVAKPAEPNQDAARRPSGMFTRLTHQLYTGEISYDFVGNRKRWYILSGVLLLVSVLALAIFKLNLGIEFKGGADFQAPVRVSATTVDEFRQAVAATSLPDLDDVNVTTIGDGSVRIQTRSLSVEEVSAVKQAIATKAGLQPDQVAYSLIGASWGQQITQQGLIALGVFLFLVMLMIWAYFREFKMSVAAIAALIHDLIVTVGIYALVGFTVTPATLIGVLTILGYSLYDTVVVFDKVRENVKDITSSRRTYSEAANAAVNQVLVRSLNTTVIGVLPVAALLVAGWFILGVGPLKDLGLALFVGMIAGAYSSVFIATPMLAQMKEAEPEMKEHRERLERRAKRHATAKPVEPATESRTVSADGSTTMQPTEAVDPGKIGLVSANSLSPRTRVQPQRTTRSKRKK